MSRTLDQFKYLDRPIDEDDDEILYDESGHDDDHVNRFVSHGGGGGGAVHAFLDRLKDDEFFYDTTEPEHEAFATLENFTQSLTSVNQRLMTYGIITQPLSFETQQDHIRILNAFYRLINRRQEDIDFRDRLADKMSRLQCDNQNLSNNLKKSRKDLDNAQREIVQLRIKAKNSLDNAKKVYKKLNTQHEKLKLENHNLLQKQNQYEHKLHRQELEQNKLKDRFAKQFQDRAGYKVCLNAPDRQNESIKKIWKHGTQRNEDTLYQNIVGAFQDEKQELVQENNQLRLSLRDLALQVHQLRNVVYAQRGLNDHIDSTMSDMNDGQFEVPYDMAQSHIEGTIHEKLQEIERMAAPLDLDEAQSCINALQQILLSSIADPHTASKAKQFVDRLHQLIDRQHQVIHQQMTLLHYDTKQALPKDLLQSSPLDQSSSQERDILEEQRRTLEQRQLELESRAQQLDEQRVQLNVMAEKVNADKQKLQKALQHKSFAEEDLMSDDDGHLHQSNKENTVPSL